MGYYSSVKGTIKITRETVAIPDELLEEIEKHGLKVTSQYKGLSLDALNRIENTEYLQGYVTASAVALTGTDDENKVYWLEEGLAQALKIIEADGCVANGYLAIFGEEDGDIWRLLVVNNQITKQDAILSWPDGSKVIT